jgi:hypothetical protein
MHAERDRLVTVVFQALMTEYTDPFVARDHA